MAFIDKADIEKITTIAFFDLKLKYQNSVFGLLWSLFKPLLQMVVYYTVFALILGVGEGLQYATQLFLGVLLWSFFAESTSMGMMSFVSKSSLMTKIKVNKLIPPVASVLSPAINLGVNLAAFLAVYFILSYFEQMESSPNWSNSALFLAAVIQLCLITLSISTLLSMLFVFFRDIQQVWELVLIYGIFLTPILYPINVPPRYEALYFIANPLAFVFQNFKSLFFSVSLTHISIQVAIGNILSTIALTLLASTVFNKYKNRIVDYL